MKRYISVFVCCILIAGTFSACSAKSSSSSSVSAETADNSVYGRWNMGVNRNVIISSDGKVAVEAAKSAVSVLEFNSDGTGSVSGLDFGKDAFDFDGETYCLHADTSNDLTMKKKEKGSADDFYGKYTLESGTLYDSLKKGYENRAAQNDSDEKYDDSIISTEMDVSDGRTDIVIKYVMGELSADDTIKLELGSETVTGKYAVNGDTLTITPENGSQIELSRIK